MPYPLRRRRHATLLLFIHAFGENPDRKQSGMAKPVISMGPRRLGPLITRIARKSAGRRGLPTAEILANWRSIVGPDLAPLTVPEQVTFPRGAGDGGTLKLRVAAGFGPVVAQASPQIIARLNTYFGYGAVARLRMVQGPAAALPAEADRPGWAEPEALPAEASRPDPSAPDDDPQDAAGDSTMLPVLRRLRTALSAPRPTRRR